MPTTGKQAFPYPASSAAPNVPADIQSLAQSVENRVVQIYASTADRSTKQTAPVEGMISWLQDSNRFDYYSGAGAWVPLTSIAAFAFVNTSQSTSSDTFTDLTTSGPACSLVLPTQKDVIVLCSAKMDNTGGNGAVMGFAISGATTANADTVGDVVEHYGVSTAVESMAGFTFATCNAGTNTFTAKYRRDVGGSAVFDRRRIAAWTIN